MDADLVNAAAALRWARPDLTAELADHVLEEASSAGHQDRWLAAAGWAVHARVAIGDGRDTACALLAALPRWGGDALSGAAAQRLRVELAMVAAGAGEVEAARRFLSDVRVDGTDAELAADLLSAHARCAVEDAPDEVAAALDAADAAWGTVGGAAAELGGASVALVRAVVERRAGRPAVAVDHAAEGLARLERGRAGAGRPSSHLAAALAAEWISALLDAGRPSEAADGCNALLPRLSELARPTRQMALLRLTVTRALAAHDPRADTAQLLAQAAEDAAGSDVPDLEAVCRTALGALHEQAGQLDVALESLQLAVGAERRDRDRSRRLLAALAELSEPVEPELPKRRRERAAAPAATTVDDAFSADATTVLPAITRSDRKLRSNRRESQDSLKPRSKPAEDPVPAAAPPAEAQDREPAWEAVPWNGAAGDSPIGDLLIHSLRNGSPGPSENGSGRRNGKSVGPRDHATDEPGASGWVPMLDSGQGDAEQTPVRRRGRFSDADRRRPRRAEDGPDEPSAAQEQPRPGRRRARDDNAGAAGASATEGGATDSAAADSAAADSAAADSAAADSAAADSAAADSAAADSAAAGNRAARHSDSPGAGGSGRRSRSSGGARRRAEEPPDGDQPSPELPAVMTGEARQEAASDATPVSPDAASVASGGSDDSGGWLEAALAELDRALSGIGVGASYSAEERPAPEQQTDVPRPDVSRSDVAPPEVGMPEVGLSGSPLGAEQPADDGCVVVVDVARDGRRFAGPRAAAVVRSVADLVADQLPSGARSRFGDSDALVVTRAGWSRGDATGWMHRTLPALLDGFVAAEELPGAQLRVAVHDADGPVGAQLLQPLTDTRAPWADLTTSASEERGQKFRAARAERREHGSRVRRTEAAEDNDHEGDAQGWPFSGDTQPADVEELLRDDLPIAGRHGSGRAQSEGPARGDTGGRGRRHRADDTGDQAGDQTQTGATGEPQRTLAGAGRAARRRSAENAAEGSAGSGSVGSGSTTNGSNTNGSATGGSTSNGSTSGGRSAAGRSAAGGPAAQGSAAGGAAVGESAGYGATGNGSVGNGSVGNGSVGNGSVGNGSVGNGSVGNGSAGSRPAGTGSSGGRSASDGAASSDSVTSDSVTNTSVTNTSGTNGAGSNGAGTNGAGTNGAGTNGAAGHNATGDATASGSTSAAAEPERAESTEGLGIADLLAGALAAYRGI